MNTNKKRVGVPFLFRAADGMGAGGKLIARSYGAEVEGVFTRAGVKQSPMTDAAEAVFPHSIPALGALNGVPALLMDAAAPTNLVANASDFSNVSWAKNNVNVSANTTVAPDGTTTADTLTTATAFGGTVAGGVAFTGNGTKWAVFYVKASGTAASVDLTIYDDTDAVQRHQVRATWAASGVPTLATNNGTGHKSVSGPFVRGADRFYRVLMSADNVVAANTNQVVLGFPSNAPTAAVIAWQVFASDTLPGSAIEVGRVADTLYFPFALVPQAITVYSRTIKQGTTANGGPWGISNAGTTDAFFLFDTGSLFRAFHRRATDVLSDAAAYPAFGDTVEHRAVLSATGTVTLGQSINAATEAVAATSAALALISAWTQQRIWIGSYYALGPANVGITHVCVALGTKTLAEMRVLAEV